MNTLASAAFGALMSAGGVLLWASLTGGLTFDRSGRLRHRFKELTRLRQRVGFALMGAVLVGATTRWIAAAGVAAIVGWLSPGLVGGKKRRQLVIERSEAVATWAESVASLLAAGGLGDAIQMSARVAPDAISTEVRNLAARAEFSSLSDALRNFARELDDPVGDSVIAALVIAVERQSKGLRELLTEVARSSRESAAMSLRIESGRSRTYMQSRFIVVFTLVFALGLVTLDGRYMASFGSTGGQVMLAVIGGLFGGAMWQLEALSRPSRRNRLLAGIGRTR